jgi:hypothetical protein
MPTHSRQTQSSKSQLDLGDLRQHDKGKERDTYDTPLHIRRLPVKDVARLDAVVDHPDRTVKGPEQMRRHLARFVRHLLAILLANGDEESGAGEG